jgi:hypothetical protein
MRVQALPEKDMHESMDIYLCECSDRRCADPIGMTRPENEAVPAVPVRSRSPWTTRIPRSIGC